MLAEGLWWLEAGAANTYLWQTPGGVVVVDPGLPGNESLVLQTIEQLSQGPLGAVVERGGGASGRTVASIVVTHWHADHAGAAGALAQATGAAVYAGVPDAAVLTGESPPVPPDLTAEEEPLCAAIAAGGALMDPPRVAQVRGLQTGDAVPGAPGGTVVVVGGHTAGSLAVHLPGLRAVLTGDIAGRDHAGEVTGGLFHADRAQARSALRGLAALGSVIAGLGHGQPIGADAAALLSAAT